MTAHAQGGDVIRQIGPALENAGVPLTEEQQEKILSVEAGPDFQQQIVNILTEDQLAALQQQSGNPTIPQILEDAGHPLTSEQIEKLNAIGDSPDARQQMMEVFTEEQREALDAFSRQQQQRQQQQLVMQISAILEQAEQPLTGEQTEKMNAVEPGPNIQQEILDILTEEQLQVLQQPAPQSQ